MRIAADGIGGVARETHPPATSPASLKILRGSFYPSVSQTNSFDSRI